MHGTGYGNGIQVFGAYILQIGILHCGSIDGYNRILGIAAAAAVGQRKISIIIEGAAVAVAVAMYSGQFQLVLTLLLLVYLSETFQIRRRQQQ